MEGLCPGRWPHGSLRVQDSGPSGSSCLVSRGERRVLIVSIHLHGAVKTQKTECLDLEDSSRLCQMLFREVKYYVSDLE